MSFVGAIKALVARCWNSPTLTSWGSYAIQSIRLLLVTPLLLTRFDSNELAAWYLFASLLMFGNTVTMGLGVIFSRMIALAVGGATDLSPSAKRQAADKKSPNWGLIESVYNTLGSINLWLAPAAVGVASVMGCLGLQSIAATAERPDAIWAAFVIVVLSHGVTVFFHRQQVLLGGLGKVALVNRWSMLSSLVSVVAGFAALSLGANIWQLSLTMQVLSLLNVVRYCFLKNWVENGRCRDFRGRGIDRQVLHWAKAPFFKTLLSNLANRGTLHVAAMVYARYASAEDAAAYLFTMMLLLTAKSISEMPHTSHLPMMATLYAKGELERLRAQVYRKIAQATGLFSAAVALLIIAGPFLMQCIGSASRLLPAQAIAIIGLFMSTRTYQGLVLNTLALNNEVACFRRMMLAGAVSWIMLPLLGPVLNAATLIAVVYLPQVILLHMKPTWLLADRLNTSRAVQLRRTMVPFGLSLVVIIAAGIVIR